MCPLTPPKGTPQGSEGIGTCIPSEFVCVCVCVSVRGRLELLLIKCIKNILSLFFHAANSKHLFFFWTRPAQHLRADDAACGGLIL